MEKIRELNDKYCPGIQLLVHFREQLQVGVTVRAFGGFLVGDGFHAVKKHQHDQGKDK